MKRFSAKRRRYHAIVVRKRTIRALISRAKAKLRRGGIPKAGSQSMSRKLAKLPIQLFAPRTFYVGDVKPRRQVLDFFGEIRRAIHLRRKVRISFRLTQRMMPCGTLLFLAELDHIQRYHPGKRMFSCDYPTDLVVEQVLQQVGLLDLLGKPARQSELSFAESVKHWRFATGVTVEGAKVEPLVEAMEGRLSPALTQGLFVGLTEAMTNCSHHAYLGQRGDGFDDRQQRRWWMFSQERDGVLSVSFCDLGIGIPNSVRSSGMWDIDILSRILESLRLKNWSESSLIRAALELSRTRTNEPHRGKGLPQILDVIKESESGYLRIMSNRGMFHYNAASRLQSLRDFAASIGGTMIQWNIPLPGNEQLPLRTLEPMP